MEKYDIFITCSMKDYIKIDLCLEYLHKHIKNFDKIYLVTPNLINKSQLERYNIEYFNDKDVLNINPMRWKYRPNWIYQQFIKLFQNITKNDYEIIVIDDGSTDNSIEIIKKFNTILFHSDHEFKNTKNQSLCRNIGIKNASGKYIRFLDGDDYFNSKALYREYLELQNLNNDLILGYH